MVQCVAKRLETWARLRHLLHESHEFGRSARKIALWFDECVKFIADLVITDNR